MKGVPETHIVPQPVIYPKGHIPSVIDLHRRGLIIVGEEYKTGVIRYAESGYKLPFYKQRSLGHHRLQFIKASLVSCKRRLISADQQLAAQIVVKPRC